jgi:preprotein translocase subunit Sec61beta
MYDEELEKLKIEHLIFPFSLLVVGLLISLVVFLAEQCWAKWLQ